MKNRLMMILVGSLLLAGNVFSEDGCDDPDFKITLYNNSPYTCSLLNPSIIYGRLDSGTSIPNYLAAGSSHSFRMMEKGQHGASIRLTYQCELDHEITFTSHSNLRPTRLNPMKGTVNSSKNMRAVVTSKTFSAGGCWSKMNWALEISN